jgi:hypothetical protein
MPAPPVSPTDPWDQATADAAFDAGMGTQAYIDMVTAPGYVSPADTVFDPTTGESYLGTVAPQSTDSTAPGYVAPPTVDPFAGGTNPFDPFGGPNAVPVNTVPTVPDPVPTTSGTTAAPAPTPTGTSAYTVTQTGGATPPPSVILKWEYSNQYTKERSDIYPVFKPVIPVMGAKMDGSAYTQAEIDRFNATQATNNWMQLQEAAYIQYRDNPQQTFSDGGKIWSNGWRYGAVYGPGETVPPVLGLSQTNPDPGPPGTIEPPNIPTPTPETPKTQNKSKWGNPALKTKLPQGRGNVVSQLGVKNSFDIGGIDRNPLSIRKQV